MRFLDGTGIALSPNATSESTIANLYALRGFSLKQSEHLRTSRESAYLPYRGTQSNLAKLTLAVADISTTISNMQGDLCETIFTFERDSEMPHRQEIDSLYSALETRAIQFTETMAKANQTNDEAFKKDEAQILGQIRRKKLVVLFAFLVPVTYGIPLIVYLCTHRKTSEQAIEEAKAEFVPPISTDAIVKLFRDDANEKIARLKTMLITPR